jgi:predicted molibdopterin-dependent oxidoreductase YjgC
VRTPHIEADYHLPLRPGTNVAVLTALAHVIVTEAWSTRPSSASAATGRVRGLGEFVAQRNTARKRPRP